MSIESDDLPARPLIQLNQNFYYILLHSDMPCRHRRRCCRRTSEANLPRMPTRAHAESKQPHRIVPGVIINQVHALWNTANY